MNESFPRYLWRKIAEDQIGFVLVGVGAIAVACGLALMGELL